MVHRGATQMRTPRPRSLRATSRQGFGQTTVSGSAGAAFGRPCLPRASSCRRGDLPVGLRGAILHFASANATRGLRRWNADKRRAVLLLLEDEDWSTWADREIARRCAVSHDFVSRLRGSLSSDDSERAPRTYQDRHGNVTRMRTSSIGRRPAQAFADPIPNRDPARANEPTPD